MTGICRTMSTQGVWKNQNLNHFSNNLRTFSSNIQHTNKINNLWKLTAFCFLGAATMEMTIKIIELKEIKDKHVPLFSLTDKTKIHENSENGHRYLNGKRVGMFLKF